MKALVLKAYNHLELKDVPQPRPGEDEALVRVRICGICGSDVHGMDGSTGRRIPPVIMGHEAAGVVEEVGRSVHDFASGDRVAVDSTVWCGACWYCRRGMGNLCDRRQVLGVSCDEYRRDGAFAEFVAVPARILYRLPDGMSFSEAAMAEPLSVAVHATRRARASLADCALVVGAGPIGLFVVMLLRAAGCDPVVAVDVDPGRLSLASKLGAHLSLDSRSTDVKKEVQALTEGRGADVAFEAVGVTEALAVAMDSLRKGGSLVLVGNLMPKVDFAQQSAVAREIALLGSYASCNDFAHCLRLIASRSIDAMALLGAVAPLGEGPSWFSRLHGREPGLLKVQLAP